MPLNCFRCSYSLGPAEHCIGAFPDVTFLILRDTTASTACCIWTAANSRHFHWRDCHITVQWCAHHPGNISIVLAECNSRQVATQQARDASGQHWQAQVKGAAGSALAYVLIILSHASSHIACMAACAKHTQKQSSLHASMLAKLLQQCSMPHRQDWHAWPVRKPRVFEHMPCFL